MARFPRVKQVVFGPSGLVGTGGFGAAALGTNTTEVASTSTLANLMSTTAWNTNGWIDAVLGASKFPAVEDLNASAYIFSSQLAYLLQQGIPEYDSATTYFIGNICVDPDTANTYQSIADNNTGNPLTDTAHWRLYKRILLTGNTTFYVATTGKIGRAHV